AGGEAVIRLLAAPPARPPGGEAQGAVLDLCQTARHTIRRRGRRMSRHVTTQELRRTERLTGRQSLRSPARNVVRVGGALRAPRRERLTGRGSAARPPQGTFDGSGERCAPPAAS